MRLLVLLALLAGCASTPQTPPLRPGEVASARSAREAIATGRSTKADVRAALGPATEIAFDGGYEVWVYRQQLKAKEPPPRTELVLLFAPSGLLEKARVR